MRQDNNLCLTRMEKQRKMNGRIKMKKIISIVLCVVMLVTTMSVPALANSNLEDVFAAQGIEMFEFDAQAENVLDALQRANLAIDLTDAAATEKVDAYGNIYFVVETPMTEVRSYNEVTLAELAGIFLNDPEVNARLIGNTLTYTLPDGTAGIIVETVDRRGRRTLEVIEGGLRDEIVFDSSNGQILVDGGAVTVHQSEEFVIQQFAGAAPRSQQWIFLMTVITDIHTPQTVRNTAAATVAALIIAAFPQTNVRITTATIIINHFRDLNPNSRSVYARRRMYHDNVWVFFRYVDSFYVWDARTVQHRIVTTTATVLG